ncbi:MAG: hypothetical protein U9O98_06645 [Asgard group archaeon]|nr:hypothetical protein [Asgard group archaeon]
MQSFIHTINFKVLLDKEVIDFTFRVPRGTLLIQILDELETTLQIYPKIIAVVTEDGSVKQIENHYSTIDYLVQKYGNEFYSGNKSIVTFAHEQFVVDLEVPEAIPFIATYKTACKSFSLNPTDFGIKRQDGQIIDQDIFMLPTAFVLNSWGNYFRLIKQPEGDTYVIAESLLEEEETDAQLEKFREQIQVPQSFEDEEEVSTAQTQSEESDLIGVADSLIKATEEEDELGELTANYTEQFDTTPVEETKAVTTKEPTQHPRPIYPWERSLKQDVSSEEESLSSEEIHKEEAPQTIESLMDSIEVDEEPLGKEEEVKEFEKIEEKPSVISEKQEFQFEETDEVMSAVSPYLEQELEEKESVADYEEPITTEEVPSLTVEESKESAMTTSPSIEEESKKSSFELTHKPATDFPKIDTERIPEPPAGYPKDSPIAQKEQEEPEIGQDLLEKWEPADIDKAMVEAEEHEEDYLPEDEIEDIEEEIPAHEDLEIPEEEFEKVTAEAAEAVIKEYKKEQEEPKKPEIKQPQPSEIEIPDLEETMKKLEKVEAESDISAKQFEEKEAISKPEEEKEEITPEEKIPASSEEEIAISDLPTVEEEYQTIQDEYIEPPPSEIAEEKETLKTTEERKPAEEQAVLEEEKIEKELSEEIKEIEVHEEAILPPEKEPLEEAIEPASEIIPTQETPLGESLEKRLEMRRKELSELEAVLREEEFITKPKQQRITHITYYDYMQSQKIFPLEIRIPSEILKDTNEQAPVTSNGDLSIRPVFPGCYVTPIEENISLHKKKDITVEFNITPIITRGNICGKIYFFYKHNNILTVNAPVKIRNLLAPKILGALGLLGGLLPIILLLFDVNLNEALSEGITNLFNTTTINPQVFLWSELGFFILMMGISLVLVFVNKPTKKKITRKFYPREFNNDD